VQRYVNAGLVLGLVLSLGLNVCALRGGGEDAATHVRANVPASFNPDVEEPRLGAGTYIDPMASVIGDVRLGRRVMVAPFASIRGDEGQPIRIGSRTNIQDSVVLHALETMDNGHINEKNLVEHNGKKYAIYIGDEVSLAHQSQVHGPAKVGDRTFIGMQALVFKAEVGEGVVLEPAAKVIGVKIESGRYVPAGAVITTQAQADALPVITPDYAFRTLNDGVIHVNTQLADGYLGNGKTEKTDKPATSHAVATTQSAAGHAGTAKPASSGHATAAAKSSTDGHGAAATPKPGDGHGTSGSKPADSHGTTAHTVTPTKSPAPASSGVALPYLTPPSLPATATPAAASGSASTRGGH
jgi:carbonic anhydrase/acetyltransferase-like protein (isoleucine patch superfamily)